MLTNEQVKDLFDAKGIVDAGVPKYAEGFDNNNVPGFDVDEHDADAVFGREMENASSTSDISINPMLRGGARRRKTKRRGYRKSQKGGRRGRLGRGRGGGKPRFQLTMKATIRMRSRSQRRH